MTREIKLSPSVLAADFSRLGEQIKAVENAGAPYLHLDVMDGAFVPNISMGPVVISGIRKLTGMVLDVHLMINRPERYISEFAKAGADIITIHVESTDKVSECIDLIHQCGCKAGITLKPATPFSSLLPYLDNADMVLIMTVEPGFGGQSYIDAMTDKITEARAGFDGDIEVDGGITADNVQNVISAGANVIVAGSAIFGKPDIAQAVNSFIH